MNTTTERLLKQAIVGLDRQALDPALLPEILHAVWQQAPAERATEERFLDAAALVYCYETAGKRQGGTRFSELPPLNPETKRTPPPRVSQVLADALKQDDPAALIGCLHILGTSGYHLPDALLCDLLDYAQRDDELITALLGCLSEKAYWLSSMNTAWQGLAISADRPQAFIEGRAAAKKRFVAWCHPLAPETTGKLLSEHWTGHTAKEREAFLELIASSLHEADRELLEICRNERSERVRRKALRLLSALGDDTLAEQALAICRQAIRLQGKGRRAGLHFELPESRGETLKALGVVESPDDNPLAKPIQWLGQVLELLPPSRLAEMLELSPGELARQLIKHDIGCDLIGYCDQGARLHKDQEWMEQSIRAVDKKQRIARLCTQLACLEDARLLPLLDELRSAHGKELASEALIATLANERKTLDPALTSFILTTLIRPHHGKTAAPHSLRHALALLLTRLPATAYLEYDVLSRADFKQPPEHIPSETGARIGQLLKLFYDLQQELDT